MILYISFILIGQSYSIHKNHKISTSYIFPKVINVSNSLNKFHVNDLADGFNYYDADESSSLLDQSENSTKPFISRSRYVNNVTLLGNVGTDLRISDYATGNISATFSLATVDSWRDYRTDEYKSKTHWHKINVFSQNIIRYLREHMNVGDRVYVSGKIKYYLIAPPELGGKKFRMNYISVNNTTGTVIIVSKKKNLRDNEYSGLYDRIERGNEGDESLLDDESILNMEGNIEEQIDENVNMDDLPMDPVE